MFCTAAESVHLPVNNMYTKANSQAFCSFLLTWYLEIVSHGVHGQGNPPQKSHIKYVYHLSSRSRMATDYMPCCQHSPYFFYSNSADPDPQLYHVNLYCKSAIAAPQWDLHARISSTDSTNEENDAWQTCAAWEYVLLDGYYKINGYVVHMGSLHWY